MDILDRQKNIHKLIYYLCPSECTGNSIIYSIICRYLGFPGLNGKVFTCHPGDMGLTPVGKDPPARGHGNLLQYSCRENSMDRGARRATVTGSQRVRHDCSNWAHRHACIVPFQELLNQEHRCKKQGIGYFKVRNQLYKYSSCGKICVSHSVQITWRKDELKLLMPITKFFQVWINKAMNLAKQNRGSQETQRENAEIPQSRF